MPEKFENWAILELMGHRRMGGYVQEISLFGVSLLRIDIPTDEGEQVTQLYGAQAIYCLTPCSEEAARAVAARQQPQPVHIYELPAPAPMHVYDEELEDDGLF
jgi:hypothetical protein